MIKYIKDSDLPQGSEEWLAMRRNHGTASEAASAMGVSPWIPKTPLQLWELKHGELTIKMNFAMQIGNDTEDEARECFQEYIGKIYEPICIVDDETFGLPLMASLDGREIMSGGTSIVEIKVPLNGSDSPLWRSLDEGADLPIQYQLQMTQQMMLSGETECHFWVYDRFNHTGRHQLFKMDPAMKQDILDSWTNYFKGKPEPGPKDIIQRDDAAWTEQAETFLAAKMLAVQAKSMMDEARGELIQLCEGKSHKGSGVRVRVNHDTQKWTITQGK